MHSAPPPILWFRPAIRRPVRRVWAQSAMLVLVGATILGLLRSFGVDFGNTWLFAWGVGLLFVMAGPIWLTTRLSRLLGVERVLSIHADGLRWQEGDHFAVHWPWEALRAISVVEIPGTPTRLRLEAEGGAPMMLPADFDDVRPAEVVALLLELQQKSQLGLPVRPRIWPPPRA
jgi:hypothetical protein